MLDSSFKTERQNQSDANISETSRILKLRERVNTAQKRLHLIENTKRDARRIFSKLDEFESPVRLSKDNFLNITTTSASRPYGVEYENDYSYRGGNVTRQNIIDEQENEITHILPTNQRQKILKEILVKMDLYKLNSPSTQKIIDYFQEKIESSKPFYYDFLRENNSLILKVLIQILYEEVENISNQLEQGSQNNNNQLELIEKKLNEKNILCDRLTEELVQLNIELESVKKRAGPATQDGSRVSLDHFFFVELKLLLQNIFEEIFSSKDEVTEDKKLNFRYITKIILDKLTKIDMETLKENYQNDYYMKTHDMPRSVSDDRSLRYMFEGVGKGQSGETRRLDIGDKREKIEESMKAEFIGEISALRNENRELKKQLEARMKIGEARNVGNNQEILMEELKRALGEKEKMEEEFEKLKQLYQVSKEELNLLSNDMEKIITERENHEQNLIGENKQLKEIVKIFEGEVKKMESRMREETNKIEKDLVMAREKIVELLNEKTSYEKEAFELRVEKKELMSKVQSYEIKMKEMVNERGNTLANITAYDTIIKDKNTEIDRLRKEKKETEETFRDLKEKEKIFTQEIETSTSIKNEKARLQRELIETHEALQLAEEQIGILQDERRILQSKIAAFEVSDNNNVSAASVEQIANAIIAQSNFDVKLNESDRKNLQGVIEAKLMQTINPLKHKLKRSEATVNEYKDKYRDKTMAFIDKLEDAKWLSGVVLQANETLARSDNDQIPATLIVFKEELERKKDMIKGKLKEIIYHQEMNQNELKVIFDEQENLLSTNRGNEEFGYEGEKDEFEKIKEENEKLRNKLQTQAYEISALNSQLKLVNTVEETKRFNQTNKEIRSSRGNKSTKDISRMNSAKFQAEDEEEIAKVMTEVSGSTDLLLMLQSQASSIEILLGNGY